MPAASETIAYGILCFTYHYLLVGLGTTKSAASFHVMNPELLDSNEDQLVGIYHSKTTLHFPPEEPLPTRLITDLVRQRVKENEKRAAEQAVQRNSPGHYAAALRAASTAAEVLPLFERQHPNDRRPRDAIDAITDWAKGKRSLGMAETRRLSLAAHAAARDAGDAAAQFAARAAGHAVATWHVPSHAEGASVYASKALRHVIAASVPPS